MLPTPIPVNPGAAVGVTDAFSPSCPVPGYSTLSAGPIVVTNPAGVPAQITPTEEPDGTVTYSATLPVGFVKAGVFRIVSAGGDNVGAFQVSVTAGPEIQVTSQYPQGSGLGGEPAYTVNWTGGEVGQAVTERVIAQELLYNGIWINKVVATAGTAGIPTGGGPTPVPAAQTTEIQIELGPDPGHITTFTVPGLILGGRVYVIYEYRFINIPG